MRRSLHLHASDPDSLPLGFEAGQHLEGRKDAWREVDTGRVMAGRLLTRALHELGIGEKKIVASGKYRPEGTEPGHLDYWTEGADVAGVLDARQLGALVHALVRRVARRGGEGNTPPEIYILEISVTLPAPKVQRELFEKPRPIFRERVGRGKAAHIIYRDRSTGRFAKRDDWTTATQARKR